MKKKSFIINLLAFIIIAAAGIIYSRGILFVYNNPEVNTNVLKYISPTIEILDKGFKAANEDHKITYLYQNAYGSGFLKNNPVPNDLDYAIGINLGEYKYNGKNSKEIAKSLMDKIYGFQYNFLFYMNGQKKDRIYLQTSPLKILSNQRITEKTSIEDLSNYFEKAMSKDSYLRFTRRFDQDYNFYFDMPYAMHSGEILLQNTAPIILYTYGIKYNNYMYNYLREISVIPEYYFTLVKDNKKYNLEIVPESFVGARLQLSRRFFVPSVFVKSYSAKYLDNAPFMRDKNEYLRLRLLSFNRHLQLVQNFAKTKDNPVKMLKRLTQCAEIIKPLLSEKDYKEISNFVRKELGRKDVVLLNDYMNVVNNIFDISESEKLYPELVMNGEMNNLYLHSVEVLKELEKRETLKNSVCLKDLKQFSKKIKRVTDGRKTKAIYDEHENINKEINAQIFDIIGGTEQTQKYINIFENIYTSAGFKPVAIYYLDRKTIGIIKNKNTSMVKNWEQYAKHNDMPRLKYKFISIKETPNLAVKYTLWRRFAVTAQQEAYYKKMKNILWQDRKNYKVRTQFIY